MSISPEELETICKRLKANEKGFTALDLGLSKHLFLLSQQQKTNMTFFFCQKFPKTLISEGKGIGPEQCQKLCDALSSNSTLTQLSMSFSIAFCFN